MAKENNERSIEIQSESMDDIMGKQPTWILRRGITVFCMVIVALLIGTWLIHYPDTVTVPVIITSTNPPIEFIAPSGGRIQSFLVKNQQKVEPGDYLVILENPVNTYSIKRLHSLIHLLDSSLKFQIEPGLYDANISNLGVLEQPYNRLIQSVKKYRLFCSTSFENEMIKNLNRQIKLLDSQLIKLKSKASIDSFNLTLSQITGDYDSLRLTLKENSPDEFDKAGEQLLNNKQTSINKETVLSVIRIEIARLEQHIWESRMTEKKEEQDLLDKTNEAAKDLIKQFEIWEKTYVLKSSSTGTVLVWKNWSSGQSVEAGEIVLSIKPEKAERVFGKATIAIENPGRIKVNQKVLIKLQSFPYPEFGVLTGKIRSISGTSANGKCILEIDLTKGLSTNYNRQLPLTYGMTGTAEIITEDKRLLERLIAPLR
ncbi:MAG TPA: hypothetical protein DEO70_14185 [Bacteroidales bacterium]|nr:MAG: hypothetical protein A2X11_13490 [Bacteroidetes bacterium GWE2_42_24]OFY26719.1 MAG: hypothetical protein A2X09_09940 [Bacteroidetes bacterium GWF2_43_11]HBZ67979.1 hypothetical protein [Bacteroidales bacterium]